MRHIINESSKKRSAESVSQMYTTLVILQQLLFVCLESSLKHSMTVCIHPAGIVGAFEHAPAGGWAKVCVGYKVGAYLVL